MAGVLCDAALGVGGAPSRLLQAAAAGWGAGGRLSLRAALWGALVRTPTGLAMGLGECGRVQGAVSYTLVELVGS